MNGQQRAGSNERPATNGQQRTVIKEPPATNGQQRTASGERYMWRKNQQMILCEEWKTGREIGRERKGEKEREKIEKISVYTLFSSTPLSSFPYSSHTSSITHTNKYTLQTNNIQGRTTSTKTPSVAVNGTCGERKNITFSFFGKMLKEKYRDNKNVKQTQNFCCFNYYILGVKYKA
jgi:hypothetical protein